MHTSTARITKSELANMIDRAVEEKLLQLLGDPDENLVFKKSLRTRLLRQKRAVAKGQRGEDFNRLVSKLGLR
jgi:DNA primase large subunit